MKTAIYIEDGVVQLVITPENEFEKNAMKSFGNEQLNAQIFRGTFYDCRGGWVRQSEYFPSSHFGNDSMDSSLILRVTDKLENSK